MPRFAANLTMMFNELPLEDRFEAAAEAGFETVEYLFPYALPAERIAEKLRRFDLTQAMFNMPPGDWEAGERGLAVFPERLEELKSGVERALDYAEATGARRLHLMAGLGDRNDPVAVRSYRHAVAFAAGRLGERQIELLLEPINPRGIPGYFLDSFDFTESVIADLGIDNVRLQYDFFHRQILHGDVTEAFRRLLPMVGHVQIASVPSRNEPDGEELNYPFLFQEMDRLGYQGFVGCEYRPRGSTVEGLGWFEPFRRS